jgi:cysteine desulfurase
MNIDMLSASGHKFHGPKGIGFLYVSNKVKIGSFIHGGSQERSRRAGTHNVPGIIGMAKAASIANTNMSENIKNISAIRDHIIDRVLAEIPYSRVNGDRTDRLPGNVHFCFRFIEGESMLIMLDQKGICGSSGSACTSGSLDPSHVLLAIGLPHEIAHGSLRLSLGEDATIEDADYVVDELKGIVERLRSMSPLYEDFVKEQGK